MLHSCVGDEPAAFSTAPEARSLMPQGRAVSPEIVAEARRLYENSTMSEVRIAALCGIAQSTLRRHALLNGWRRPDGDADREALVASLRARIDGEVAAAEAVIAGQAAQRSAEGAPGGDIEKMSRSLASLVRTLRELAKYDEERAKRAGATPQPPAEAEGADDAVADLDELRDALARRLESLREQHEV